MKRILLVLFLIFCFNNSVFAANVYDKKGKKIGSYKTNAYGVTTTCDKHNQKTGYFKTDSYGKTYVYDKYGKKIGVIKK